MVENNTPESLGIHLVNLKPDSFDGDILSFEKLFFIITVSPFPILLNMPIPKCPFASKGMPSELVSTTHPSPIG